MKTYTKQQVYACILMLLLFLAFSIASYAQGPYRSLTDTSKLVKVFVKTVHDGDTFRGYFGQSSKPGGEDTTSVLFRLASIDAPEQTSPWMAIDQPYARSSGWWLRNKIVRSVVFVDTASIKQRRDMYGRYIVDVYTKSTTSLTYVNQDMVLGGLAWYRATPRLPKLTHNSVLSKAFSKSKQSKLNIWSTNTAIAPWVWRAEHTK